MSVGHHFDFERTNSSKVRAAFNAIANAVSKPEHHRMLEQAVKESPTLKRFISRHVIELLEGKSKLKVSLIHAISAAGELGEKKHAEALITTFKKLDRPKLSEKAAILTMLFKMGHHETHSGRRFLKGIARNGQIQQSLSTFAKKLLETEKVAPTLRKAVQAVLSESPNPPGNRLAGRSRQRLTGVSELAWNRRQKPSTTSTDL